MGESDEGAEGRPQTLPVGVSDEDVGLVVDAQTLWELERAHDLRSRYDAWLLAAGLGGLFGGLIVAGTAAPVVGLAISGVTFSSMVVGKVTQHLVAKKRELDLGVDGAAKKRIAQAAATVDVEMGLDARARPAERVRRIAERLSDG